MDINIISEVLFTCCPQRPRLGTARGVSPLKMRSVLLITVLLSGTWEVVAGQVAGGQLVHAHVVPEHGLGPAAERSCVTRPPRHHTHLTRRSCWPRARAASKEAGQETTLGGSVSFTVMRSVQAAAPPPPPGLAAVKVTSCWPSSTSPSSCLAHLGSAVTYLDTAAAARPALELEKGSSEGS